MDIASNFGFVYAVDNSDSVTVGNTTTNSNNRLRLNNTFGTTNRNHAGATQNVAQLYPDLSGFLRNRSTHESETSTDDDFVHYNVDDLTDRVDECELLNEDESIYFDDSHFECIDAEDAEQASERECSEQCRRLSKSLEYYTSSSTETNEANETQPRSLNSIQTSSKSTWTTNGLSIEINGDVLKNKLLSAWNNVRHGWVVKPSTNIRFKSPLWIFATRYMCSREEIQEQKLAVERGYNPKPTTVDHIKQHFQSCIWLTYRKDFPRLSGSQLMTDVGWGCMVRCGQMLLAKALVNLDLGPDWRWNLVGPGFRRFDDEVHRRIIRYFGDNNSDKSPFSVQRLIRGKVAGEWFGPASIAYSLRDALEFAKITHPELRNLYVYVSQDCTIFKQDIIDLCDGETVRQPVVSRTLDDLDLRLDATDDGGSEWRAVLIIVPMRLGGEGLNPVYIPCLKTLLETECCLGIIGGKPKHSLYFIGYQDDDLFYLDPHMCQDHVDVLKSDFPLKSFHCTSLRKVGFNKIDPSCSIGFLCRSRREFDQFVYEMPKVVSPRTGNTQCPMFVFQDGRSSEFLQQCHQVVGSTRPLKVRSIPHKKKSTKDDFVLL